MTIILRLSTDRSHRRQDVGKALMEKAEEILRSRGYNEINILVEENHEELQNYYSEQGYGKGNVYGWVSKELE